LKKEIIDVDKARGIFRVTTADERWYSRPSKNPSTGLPEYEFVPSCTWIASHYPKGLAFYKWLAEHGWDESEALKQAAADRGSKIHLAIADLVAGKTILPDSQYLGSELTVDEYSAVITFRDWFESVRPEVLGSEYIVWNDEHGYAGTVDLKLMIKGQVWIVDVKTGQNVWPEYELQLSSYRHADTQCQRTGIIQVGYRRAKSGVKFTEIDDKFNLFLAAKEIWKNETAGQHPLQREYPMSVTIRPPSNG
jgi:hypothetical protein